MRRVEYNNAVGLWVDDMCDSLHSYICQKEKNDTQKSPNPQYCPAEKGGGWKYGDSCYHVVKKLKSWYDAEQYCKETYNGHLLTILDRFENRFVDYILSDLEDEYWIGFKIQDAPVQKWISGWHLTYHLLHGEMEFRWETCIFLGGSNNIWTRGPCSEEHFFICEATKFLAPVLKAAVRGSYCPQDAPDWKDLGGEFCYYIQTDNLVTWQEATSDCKRRGGELVSFHSKEESEILHPFVKNQKGKVFIGLSRISQGGKDFAWSDGSEMDYKNWHWNEPNNENGMCVSVWRLTMTWNVLSCDYRGGYICSVRKISPITTLEAEITNPVFPNTTDDVEGNKGVGQVSFKVLIGIFISILLIKM